MSNGNENRHSGYVYDEVQELKDKAHSESSYSKDLGDIFESYRNESENLDVVALAEYFIARGKYTREQIEGKKK